MDVKDFSPNDLQVRVVDDRVVVEGKYFKVRHHTTHIAENSFSTVPSFVKVRHCML